jgi:hypothetical protein
MIFVGGREATPAIVVFDHMVLSGPTAVERSAAFWHSGAESWQPLLDLQWTDLPIREPWRLIPHGSFRILVDDTGEVEALHGEGEQGAFYLSAVGRLGGWSPDEPPHYQLHLGEWNLAGDSVAGLLVDIQPSARAAHAAPEPVPTELFLTDGAQFHLIASLPAGAPPSAPGELWLQRGERTETMEGVLLAKDTLPDVVAWRIDARSGELQGEIQGLGAPLELGRGELPSHGAALGDNGADGSAGPEGDGGLNSRARESATLQTVRGWIQIRGERKTIFGVLRRAPA